MWKRYEAIAQRAWHGLLIALALFALLALAWTIFARVVPPSHDREWELGQRTLPTFEIEGDRLQVNQFRHFLWTGEMEAEERYETRTYDLRTLRTLDVFLSHFDDFEGLAHIFLSFGFDDGEQLVVSIESRREQGEDFSPLKGLFRQYELIYVVGSESDIVGVRTGYRGERVYRYPTVATAAEARALLEALGADINAIAAEPRFYHTLTKNCTNALTRRVEDIAPVEFPLTWKTLLPGYFDEVLSEMGLIPSAGTLEETKAIYRIDNARVDPLSPDYSRALRTLPEAS